MQHPGYFMPRLRRAEAAYLSLERGIPLTENDEGFAEVRDYWIRARNALGLTGEVGVERIKRGPASIDTRTENFIEVIRFELKYGAPPEGWSLQALRKSIDADSATALSFWGGLVFLLGVGVQFLGFLASLPSAFFRWIRIPLLIRQTE